MRSTAASIKQCAPCISLLLLAATSSRAIVDYTFTPIADSTSPTFQSFGTPSLNAAGRAAFEATLDPSGGDSTGQGIFTGAGGPTTEIAVRGPAFNGFVGASVSINAGGRVAFRGFTASGAYGIFSGAGGPTTEIFRSVDIDPVKGGLSDPAINDAGTVAFYAKTATGDRGVFTGTGGPTTEIASGGQAFNFNYQIPSINAAGTVAFSAYIDYGSVERDAVWGILTGAGGPTTEIVTNRRNGGGNVAFSTFGSPSINTAGEVAFMSQLDNNESGIFTGAGEGTTAIARSNEPPFRSFSFAPSINSAGTVAFYASLDLGGEGIYVVDGGAAARVIGIGDALFGSTVRRVSFGAAGLNDSGQLAFGYTLENEISGVAVANPVPEPATALLAGMAGAALWGGWRWRQRS